jgi:hemerythrin
MRANFHKTEVAGMTLQWNDRYLVGHEQVDHQHKHLFELINRLEAKINAGAGQKDSLEVIQALIDYALYHFADEESLMQEINFDGISIHRWRHSEFAGKIADMALEWGRGNQVKAEEIRDFLTDWLLDHILTEDMQIGAAIRRKQTVVAKSG